jgi:hypothetical protein
MADITITCQGCGNVITVSEYVSAEFLVCMKCKTKIDIPSREVTAPVTQKLKVTVEKPPAPPPPAPILDKKNKNKSGKAAIDAPRDVRQFLPKARKRIRNRQVSHFHVKVLPWLLFFGLSIIFGVMRYVPNIVDADTLKTVISGGVIVLTFLYITVICHAFTDDSFFGILCLLIPGYALYYLYIQSDQMVFRGVMAAFMVAFGWDTAVAAANLWSGMYASISHWIATTDSVRK